MSGAWDWSKRGLQLCSLGLDAEGKDTAGEGDCLSGGMGNTNLKVEAGEG